MCFGLCCEETSTTHFVSQPDTGFVQDRPIYDNTMGQTIISQPSYGYGGGLDTSMSAQPSYGGGFGGGLDTSMSAQPSYGGGGFGGGMTEEMQSTPSRY